MSKWLLKEETVLSGSTATLSNRVSTKSKDGSSLHKSGDGDDEDSKLQSLIDDASDTFEEDVSRLWKRSL